MADMRLNLIADIVNGIRSVKCYCWEDSLSARVQLIRKQEVRNLFCFNSLRFVSYCLLRYSGYVAAALVFLIKTSHQKEALSAGTAFALLGALNFLALYACLYFGEGLIALVDLRASMKRITEVLLLEEIDQSCVTTVS